MLEIILWFWFAWCASHLLCMISVRPTVPAFNGLHVSLPESLLKVLTPDEFLAVAAHEFGHRHHYHVWKNFALVCVFMRASKERRAIQELEADDYAREHGHGQALASALRKLSRHQFDLTRAKLLEHA